jgi:DASS family divalent anion:Na+ symporter
MAAPESIVSSTKSKQWVKLPVELFKMAQIVFFGFLAWYLFKPEALSTEGWNLLVIFICTIIAIIAKPLPMGAVAIVSIATLCLTKTLPLKTVLQGFSYDQIWLIVFACFLARGFIKTGLGRRIAYSFISLFGGTPYGMSYGLLVSSACMAPLIPSATARTGGIILPVLRSIIQAVAGNSSKQSSVGPFLTLVVFHASVITSAMFITANAGNPIGVKFAQNMGIEISWMDWAKAAFVPGILCLAILPPLLLKLCPCQVENAEAIRDHSKKELSQMGPLGWQEGTLIAVFGLLLVLWAFGNFFAIHATEAALFGVAILLIAKILTWKDLLEEDLAWDTFIWMGILIMMASELQNLGVISWFTDQVVTFIPAVSWQWQLLLLGSIYFYSHYFFASITAHVSSMYGPFLAVAIVAGSPPGISALFFAFLSSLFGGLTHYSSGPAPILYAEKHVDIKTWWKVGLITSIVYLLIWIIAGGLWWNILDIIS